MQKLCHFRPGTWASAHVGIRKGSWSHSSRHWGMLLFYFLPLSSSLPGFLLDSVSIAVTDLLMQGNIMMELDVHSVSRSEHWSKLISSWWGSSPSTFLSLQIQSLWVYLPEMRSSYFVNYKESIHRNCCHISGAPEAWFSDWKFRNYWFTLSSLFMFPR